MNVAVTGAMGLVIALTVACSGKPGTTGTAASAIAAADAADTIYVGGDIVTVNDAQPTVEPLAIKDIKVLATIKEGTPIFRRN